MDPDVVLRESDGRWTARGVRTLRKCLSGARARPISRQELAALLGVSERTVARWEAAVGPLSRLESRALDALVHEQLAGHPFGFESARGLAERNAALQWERRRCVESLEGALHGWLDTLRR